MSPKEIEIAKDFGFDVATEFDRYLRHREQQIIIPITERLDARIIPPIEVETIDIEVVVGDTPRKVVHRPAWVAWIENHTPTSFVLIGFDDTGAPAISCASEVISRYKGVASRVEVPRVLLQKELEVKIDLLWTYIRSQKLKSSVVAHTMILEPWLPPEEAGTRDAALTEIGSVITGASELLALMEQRLVALLED